MDELTQRPIRHQGSKGSSLLGTPKKRPSWRKAKRPLLLLGLLLAFMLGLVAGAGGAVERYAMRRIQKVELEHGLKFDADRLHWTWDGHLEIEGFRLFSQGSLLFSAKRLSVEMAISYGSQEAKIEKVSSRDPRVFLLRNKDGSTNLDGFFKPKGGGPKEKPSKKSRIDLKDARFDLGSLDLEIRHGIESEGLDLPARIVFRKGRVSFDRGEDKRVFVHFDDSNMDPGEPVSVTASFAKDGRLSPKLGVMGRLVKADIHFNRPIRFWFYERVVGIGGAQLSQDGLSLSSFQISERIKERKVLGDVPAEFTLDQFVLNVAMLPTLHKEGDDPELEATQLQVSQVALDTPTLRWVVSEEESLPFRDLAEKMPEKWKQVLKSLFPKGSSQNRKEAAAEAPEAKPDKRAIQVKGLSEALAYLDAGQKKALSLIDQFEGGFQKLAPYILGERQFSLRDGVLVLEIDDYSTTFSQILVNIHRQTGDEDGELAFRFEVENPFAKGHKLILALERKAMDHYVFQLELQAFPLSALRLLRLSPPKGSVAFEVSGELKGDEIQGHYKFLLEDLAFQKDSISLERLEDITLSLEGDIDWVMDEGKISAKEGRVTLNGLPFLWEAEALELNENPRFRGQVRLEKGPVQKLVDAIPLGLRPHLQELRMAGDVSWSLDFALDSTAPDDMVFDSTVKGDKVTVLSLGTDIDFRALRATQPYAVLLKDGSEGTRVVGPETVAWVPLEEISPYFPLAFMTTEDASFESNKGFSPFALRHSLISNLKKGRFARGGSTLTMQLIKNLFLSHHKSMARKLEEIFLAWQLTESFEKSEIMALYLNTIEFGKGVYGVGDAAWHWFGKRAADLTLAETVFLVSIVPNPRQYDSMFSQGEPGPKWTRYVERLIEIMANRNKISQEELKGALPVHLRFRGAHQDGHKKDADDLEDELEWPPEKEILENNEDLPPEEEE